MAARRKGSADAWPEGRHRRPDNHTFASGPERPYAIRAIRRVAGAPLRRPLLTLVPLLLVLGACLTLSLSLPPRYRSSALILVAPDRPDSLGPQASAGTANRRLETLGLEVRSRGWLERVAQELDPYDQLGQEPMIDTVERMRKAVTVSLNGNDAFRIEFEHTDPRMAMAVVDRLTTLFMEEMVGRHERQVSKTDQLRESRVLDPAYLPERPSFPNHGLFALAGALAGLFLGAGLAIFADFLDPTIKDVEELRSVLSYPVLAVMPYVRPRDQRRLADASGGDGDRDDTQRVRAARRRTGRTAATLPFRPLSAQGGQAR